MRRFVGGEERRLSPLRALEEDSAFLKAASSAFKVASFA
jgi:hypothetical protein